MSSVALDLLADARRHGLRLMLTPKGKIKAFAPRPPPVDLVARLKEHRLEVISALAEAEADDRAQRAALVEEGSGAPRAWAEALAQLDPDQPPISIPVERWRTFIDDAGRFLDRGWAARAAALGWTPLDLFGCDGERPLSRIDQMGLLWLLQSRELVALSAEEAKIKTRVGNLLTVRRYPPQCGSAVPAWELCSDNHC